jgi:hypothetical protein
MPKYRKKPVVIEAIKYQGESNYIEICNFVGKTLQMEYKDTAQSLIIPTLEGEMTASKGDFVIKGINGEFYPCKPDIFEKTYESVDEHSSDEFTVEQTTKDGVLKQKDDCSLKVVVSVDSKRVTSAILDDIKKLDYKRGGIW